jgi:predicted pyridoxine 5'-phosphate oxidase superfamily flavin-nucleotide-binding protein
MGVLTVDMQRVVEEQRLGFVATVCPDGTPNVSPKGTVAVWDVDTLIFADIRSPRTVANLRQNPAVEINVVDPLVRKGYRFKGTGAVHADGVPFEAGVAFFRSRGVANPIRAIVLVAVTWALPLLSPAYDVGQSEEQVREHWRRYRDEVEARPRQDVTGETST